MEQTKVLDAKAGQEFGTDESIEMAEQNSSLSQKRQAPSSDCFPRKKPPPQDRHGGQDHDDGDNHDDETFAKMTRFVDHEGRREDLKKGDARSPQEYRIDPYATNVSASGDTELQHSATSYQDDGYSGPNETEDSEEWRQLVETASDADVPNMTPYLQVKSFRTASKERFTNMLSSFMEGMNVILEETIQDAVVPIHDHQRQRFEVMQTDIVRTMTSNHKRRLVLEKRLKRMEKDWKRNFQRLSGYIRDSRQGATEVKEIGIDKIVSSQSDDENETSVVMEPEEDPDWNELAKHEPLRQNIERFLAAREKLHVADESFSTAIEAIHTGMKSDLETAINVAVELHEHCEQTCLSVEDDIQTNMASNFKRRRELQLKLEESAKQAQGMFASLLDRVCKGTK